ncbi:polysaccharide biosynthesis protein [Variovorax sp. KBW07]|uniref:polysaccharide biosynthesis protein n=1 Tax=Variovorax sp. KBW07 TaxID=2153358 RepID=UPI000F579455|nr:nucleoside-diphosphate sugar epimerase/dehydratase [Variovorax sp. KBW07]RQO62891.1 polysaccharide biosynthesis protein [Variovorax sp. KBW07]
MQKSILGWPRAKKQLIVVCLDIGLSLFSVWLAFTLRLDAFHRPEGVEWLLYAVAPALAIPVFIKFGLYRAIFRYTGMAAILATGKAVAVYGIALFPFIWGLYHWEGIPRSLIILQPVIFLLFVSSSRTLGWHWLAGSNSGSAARRLLIYGAGTAGAQTAAALSGVDHYALLGFIDDDHSKNGQSINGVPVFLATEIPETIKRLSITDVLLAMPSVSRKRRNQIIGQLQHSSARIRSLPSLTDLASGRITVSDFRDLDIEDLLGREPVTSDPELLARGLAGHVVMVTGAGGSIGSELCRQIILQKPKELVLIDHSEFLLYRIHQELLQLIAHADLTVRLTPRLANVCNFERIHAICRLHKPAVIYHAAAYKHVPLVEQNSEEGVINNVLGTLTMARVAIEGRVDRFVLISTDKAVRPTNIMGGSKRIAEMILQSLAANNEYPFGKSDCSIRASEGTRRTCFSMVRFGNVLGSSGSVVPLFRSQIAAGGPLTVTHPGITRYFMTIPEAAQLVLHAGAMAEEGDLFVLDMGSPVKIIDLAKQMIALSGHTVRDAENPAGDIQITFTGLRPGEKLFEELLIGENPLPTDHPRIIRAREDFVRWPEFSGYLQELLSAAHCGNSHLMQETMCKLIPGFKPKTVVIQ